VRRANPGGEALHPSGKDAQTRHFRRLLARFEQRLHAETNPQKRHARPEALEEGIADRQPVESAHHLPEVTHSRQDNLFRPLQARGVAHNLIAGPQRTERILDGAEVAGAVIEDGDHKIPFVLGNWSFSRRSFEQAYFMARAKHLKMASILW